MKIKGRLSYANVTATLALCVAVATGGAYAQSRIGTSDLRNRAVGGAKIKRNAIQGSYHVRNRTIPGKKIREATLNARQFSAIGGAEELECDPSGAAFEECAAVRLDLPRRGRALVVATGGNYSVDPGDAASGRCEVRIDGQEEPLGQHLGEESVVNTSALATSGFARTLVSPVLPAGSVRFSLECNQTGTTDFLIQTPTIAAIALTNG